MKAIPIIICMLFSCISLAENAQPANTASARKGYPLFFPDGTMQVLVPTEEMVRKHGKTWEGIDLISDSSSFEEGKKAIEKEAEKGDGLALCILGILHVNGEGYSQDVDKGIALIEQGTKAGWVAGYYYLARIYAMVAPEGNHAKAYEWAEKGAKMDEGYALYALSKYYLEQYKANRASEQDVYRALQCAQAAAKAAEGVSDEPIYLIAMICIDGREVLGKESERILTDLAPRYDRAKGGLLYLLADTKRYEECEQLALKYAIENNYVYAYEVLAVLYTQNINPQANTGKGIEWLRKAAEQGRESSIWFMARIHREPAAILKIPAVPDYEEARKWLLKLAEHNDTLPLVWLAEDYAMGLGCQADIPLAVDYLLKTVRVGELPSQFRLPDETKNFLYKMQKKAAEGNKDAATFLNLYKSKGGTMPPPFKDQSFKLEIF